MRFNPPPYWPLPPGWTPPAGWYPDPRWPPAPPGWEFWVEDAIPYPESHTARNVVIGVVVGIVATLAVVLPIVFLQHSRSTSSRSHPNSAAGSDEDQIRAVISNMQVAWNSSDYDRVLGNFCTEDEAKRSEESFREVRDESGQVEFTIESITVTGDTAKVEASEAFSNHSSPDVATLTFIREDGRWVFCPSS
ncbi:MAG TPA: hypothetical protein VFB19_09935 [Mycobacterium sp.]|nr:hypothetical protein [Mycobacterium sp.]